jgi:hypothetical protein
MKQRQKVEKEQEEEKLSGTKEKLCKNQC